LEESFDRLDELHKQGEGLRGVPTGYKDIDDTLAGLQKSNLLILAARPGIGKTTLALNIAQNVSIKYQRPVGFFSLEMSKEELVDRLLVAQADIDAWKLKTGKLSEDDFTKLSNAMGELAEAPLYIDDTPAMSILEMRTKARRLQVENGVDLIIIDYLQLARSRYLENRVQEVSEISQGLKNLARELKVPVLAISQLSRAVEQRGEKRPQLADLRESGSIEQDADVVMFLWREEEDNTENINLDVAKHRNGPLRSLKLFFRGDRMKFFPREVKRKD
jgi:replicative DNA helicase